MRDLVPILFTAAGTASTLEDLLPIILGAGGVGFIGAIVQWRLKWRDSAEFREGKAVANLERWRLEADKRTQQAIQESEWEREMGNYWAVCTGILKYELVSNGLPVPTLPPQPVRKVNEVLRYDEQPKKEKPHE